MQLLLDVLCSLQVQQVPLRVRAWAKGRHLWQIWMNLPQRGKESPIPTHRRALTVARHMLLPQVNVLCMMLHVPQRALLPALSSRRAWFKRWRQRLLASRRCAWCMWRKFALPASALTSLQLVKTTCGLAWLFDHDSWEPVSRAFFKSAKLDAVYQDWQNTTVFFFDSLPVMSMRKYWCDNGDGREDILRFWALLKNPPVLVE